MNNDQYWLSDQLPKDSMDDDMGFLNFNASTSAVQSQQPLQQQMFINDELNSRSSNPSNLPTPSQDNSALDQKLLVEKQKQLRERLLKEQMIKMSQQQQQDDTVQNQSQLNQRQQQQLFQQLQQQQQKQQVFHQQQFQTRKLSSQSAKSISHSGTPTSQNNTTLDQINIQQKQQSGAQSPQQKQMNQSLISNTNISTSGSTPLTQHQDPKLAQRKFYQQQLEQQFGSQNNEKFLTLLEDFMNRKGITLDKSPIIGGVKINLFLVYFMVSQLGGFTRALNERKIAIVANQLGILPSNKQLMTEFVQMYYKNLFPFEQYANTPEGMKELAIKKQRMLQQQQQQQQQQQPSNLQLPSQSTEFQPDNLSRVSPHSTPNAINHTFPENQNLKSTSSGSPFSFQNDNQSPRTAQISFQPMQQPNSSTPPILNSSVVSALKGELQEGLSAIADLSTDPTNVQFKPDFIKNYIPKAKILEKTSGFDLEVLEKYGEQLDHLKPVFLYFPELGHIDIRALSLSLASDIDAEINVALNILLIVSSDPNIALPLYECTALLENLAELGKNLIIKLISDNLGKTCVPHKKITKSGESRVDKIFEKYSGQFKGGDFSVTVDSFTSQPVDQRQTISFKIVEGEFVDSPQETVINDEEDLENNNFLSGLTDGKIGEFKMPNYLEILHECRKEAGKFNSVIHMKSYQNKRLMMVEELSTISMIFRNLSFTGNNNMILATNQKFSDFIFSLIFATVDKPDIFMFSRKKLSMMKDCLVILANVSHATEIRSELEIWLIIVLALSFGPKLKGEEKNLGFISCKVDPLLGKYHLHAVDILTKIMCGSTPNKIKINKILCGETKDVTIIKMCESNYGKSCFADGLLLVDVFTLLISVIPLDSMHQGIEPFNEKLPNCLESLLGMLVLLETLQSSTNFSKNIALEILLAPESIGRVLIHLSFVYAAIYVNNNFDTKAQHAHVSARCAELINGLIKCAIDYSVNNERGSELVQLGGLSKLFCSDENIIGMLMTLEMPQSISLQAVEAVLLMNRLKDLLK